MVCPAEKTILRVNKLFVLQKKQALEFIFCKSGDPWQDKAFSWWRQVIGILAVNHWKSSFKRTENLREMVVLMDNIMYKM